MKTITEIRPSGTPSNSYRFAMISLLLGLLVTTIALFVFLVHNKAL